MLAALQDWQSVVADFPVRLLNTYGPTEGTVVATLFDATHYQPQGPESLWVPIGKPLSNHLCYRTDTAGHLCEERSMGELCLSGVAVAKGYLNKDELTQQKFQHNSFISPSQKLYKTGDRVSLDNDGNLIFYGRVDNQIKLNGYRIELEDIQYHIEALEQVAAAVVLLKENPSGLKQLVAYIVVKEASNDTSIKQDDEKIKQEVLSQLKHHLPDYMLPSGILLLDQLPLSAHGKLDKKQLLSFDVQGLVGEYIQPESETEQRLAIIWSKVLGLETNTISRRANFFNLGGHSLLVIRLVADIQSEFHIQIEMKDVFEKTDLAELAQVIDENLLSHQLRYQESSEVLDDEEEIVL